MFDASCDPLDWYRGLTPEAARGDPLAVVLTAFRPLIEDGLARLRPRLAGGPIDVAVVAPELTTRLLPMLAQTIVLELHVARERGELDAGTPEARWQQFVARLGRPRAIVAFLAEYAVLARQLVECIDRWVEARARFSDRLRVDLPELVSRFAAGQAPGRVVAISDNAGDTHAGGDSVVIVEFESGLRVVYKPRSLALDAHFQQLLAWLDARGDHPAFRPCQILDRGAYGWVEFIAAAACASIEDAGRFYRRAGGQLALLHALCAVDMHAQNLIAAGDAPVIVDVEALFHPALPQRVAVEDSAASRAMQRSVLRVGLLPVKQWSSSDSDGIDLSGLGGAAGQLSPSPVRVLEHAGTDQMRFAYRHVPLPTGAANRPRLDGVELDPRDFVDDIAAGFTSVYRTLVRSREALLASDGPIARFAGDEVRVLVRNTYTYARLLQESFHPDVLRDALDRDRLLDQLSYIVEHEPWMAEVVSAERADLLRNDLPRFTTHAGARHLRLGPSCELADVFEESGLDRARRRLGELDEADLARQLWFLRGSFAVVAEDTGARDAGAPPRVIEGDLVSAGRLIASARALGDRVAALALHDGDRATWLGVTMTRHRGCALAPLGLDLYDGVWGVALFLGALGAATSDAGFTGLAEAATRTGLRLADEDPCTSIGGFAGWGGVIYALTQLGALWDRPSLHDTAEQLAVRVVDLIDRDDELDVLGGAAGCIAAVLELHRLRPSSQALDVAIRCGDHLIARARPMEVGLGWYGRSRPRALTGFSHGAAGIAWSLLRLAAHARAPRFAAVAHDALAYERSRFVPALGNWSDLRNTPEAARAAQTGGHACLTAWCHGAAGIGLARIGGLGHGDDATAHAEIDVALRTTLADGFGRNHSLCHGDLGNLELLATAGRRVDPVWGRRASELASALVAADDWRTGTPFSVESPGLMTGLAGIGYGLLRLARPDIAPCVLTLEGASR